MKRLLAIAGAAAALQPALWAGSVEFNRDVRPILSENCFACHGPDAKGRKADLRLDLAGSEAIVPGDAAKSALIERITTTDVDDVMPPPETHKKLSPAQKAVLKQWIAEGAKYQKHWAFEPPRDLQSQVATPGAVHPIDSFVEGKLKEKGFALAPEAEPASLIRRVSFDLTGLPPTSEFAAAFIRGELTYESAVDRLLSSKHFGEHLAVAWLDAARYADTNGYFGDKPRQMWLWRDWVINAFNANMPFDQFTIEQLAGDLLPNATVQQRIATGFNRNHMANNESGSIDEEFRTEYVVDRVDTTMTTWLGLTAGCAQCHDHKFDPILQSEFYQLSAFFNNVPEDGVIKSENPRPLIEVPSPEQEARLAQLKVDATQAAAAFAPFQRELKPKLAEWEKDADQTLPQPPQGGVVLAESFSEKLSPACTAQGTPLVFEEGLRGQAGKFDATQHVEAQLKGFDMDKPWTIGLWVNAEGSLSCPLSLIEPVGNRRGLEIIWQKGHAQVNLVHRWGVSAIEIATVDPMSSKAWHQIIVSYDGMRKAKGVRVFIDGKPAPVEVRRDMLDGTLVNREPLRIGRRDANLGFYGLIDEVRVVHRALDESAAQDWYWGERIRGLIETPVAKRNTRDSEALLDYYIERFAEGATQDARKRVQDIAQAQKDLREAIPTALVMEEMAKPRATYVLDRGQYDKPGPQVQPGVPTAIAPWPEQSPRNRLGFAQWLVSPANPLTARVVVNRLWQQCFGEGLVRTPNDFGSQGEAPTHPELLDYLAVTFLQNGWDVKKMLKHIVMSRTYQQQSSFASKGVLREDVENRWLGRGPSSRLSAEMLRDQALAISGLFNPKVGGPSVKPYQPAGLWEAVSYNGEESYVADTGSDLWRRSLYTYVKRQAPPPMLLTFDGPTREKCTARRARTNTPLQALVLLNDDVFVEASRALAERVLRIEGSDEARLQWLWLRVLVRKGKSDEIALLAGLLQRQRERFAADASAAAKLLTVGAAKRDEKLDVREHAAWTVVAQAVLNLDEAITKR